MRILAGIVVVLGLATILVGQVAVLLEHDALERRAATSSDVSAIRKAQDELSMWPAMGVGASIVGVGLLVDVVGRKVRRRRYSYPVE
jgi:hypothetical protein